MERPFPGPSNFHIFYNTSGLPLAFCIQDRVDKYFDLLFCFKYDRSILERDLNVNSMISPKQKLIFDYIASFAKKEGFAPSLEEIATHFKLKHPSAAHYHVAKLQGEGYLEKESNRPRSIGVFPDRSLNTPIHKKTGMDAMRVPVYGSANAGPATLFADGNIQGYLKVSRNELGGKGNIFALRVEGDSMNRAHIKNRSLEEGDFVLVDPDQKDAKPDDYVLSIIDDCANLKKFARDKKTGQIMLLSESSNKKHKPIYISSKDNYMINGKIVGVIKK